MTRLGKGCLSLRQANLRRGAIAWRRPSAVVVRCSQKHEFTGNYKRPPRVFTSNENERFLFQTGESMAIQELPAGTRVIYPGTRQDGIRNEQKWREMVRKAFDNPLGTKPLREKLRDLKSKTANPKVVMAFDDVSVPLPPAQSPDIRQIIMEEAEQYCVEEGVTDIKFICSIALHRFIRPDEFRHICGSKLFNKYAPQGRMLNFNAVDERYSTYIGKTRHGEDVLVCTEFIEADLAIYANCNYVAMDGGYKSYATGMVHYKSLRHNHDAKTLMQTRSLYDPKKSHLHKSINRIGKMIQEKVDIFHVETVVDERVFPFYLDWVTKLEREWNVVERALAEVTNISLKFLPLPLRKWIFWSPLIWGPFGLLQVNAGETVAVHEKTLELNYRDKVIDIDGQADILIVAPTCIGPYTKDRYMNPLLVNTYSLGYWYNMYVDGTPLLKEGGVLVVVNDMPYAWDSPAHDAYRKFFEEVVVPHGGLDEFERFQEEFANNKQLNELYWDNKSFAPAAVHGFYMYTWAAHGMDKVGKVIVVGAQDSRGPQGLKWQQASTIIEAVDAAKQHLRNPTANVTYWRTPPIGYARVHTDGSNSTADNTAAEQQTVAA